MPTYVLEREQIVPLPRATCFAFFGDAFNLELITPPFLRFRVLTEPPVEMRQGAVLEYHLSLFGVPFRWRTSIESWSPDESFVDRQLKGPYALWHHTHTFEELALERTRMRDRVLYRVPFGVFGAIAHALFVRRVLTKIFDYRAEVIARLLTPDNPGLDALTGRPSQPDYARMGSVES